MKRPGKSKQRQNRRSQMADTMLDVIGMFDAAFGKPAERTSQSPGQLRQEVQRLCGAVRPRNKKERS